MHDDYTTKINNSFITKMTCSSEIYWLFIARCENGTKKGTVFKCSVPDEFLSDFDDSKCILKQISSS